MSNHQADKLLIDILGSNDPKHTFLALKPIYISKKKLKKLQDGLLIDGFDPYNLRIVRDNEAIARVKLGEVGGHEALHVVSASSEPYQKEVPPKSVLLEARLSTMEDSGYREGDIIELRDPVTQNLLIVADGKPIAAGKLVEYDGEAWVYVTRVWNG